MQETRFIALAAAVLAASCALPQDDGSGDAVILKATYDPSRGFVFPPEEQALAEELAADGDLQVVVDGRAVPLMESDQQLGLSISAGDRLDVHGSCDAEAGDGPIAAVDVLVDAGDPSTSSEAVAAAACTNGTWSWRWVGWCSTACVDCAGPTGVGSLNRRLRKYYCAYGAWHATNVYRCERVCGLCRR